MISPGVIPTPIRMAENKTQKSCEHVFARNFFRTATILKELLDVNDYLDTSISTKALIPQRRPAGISSSWIVTV